MELNGVQKTNLQLISSQDNKQKLELIGDKQEQKLELVKEPSHQIAKITTADSANVDMGKVMSDAGVKANTAEFQNAMKEYGVSMTTENMRLAAEYSKSLPAGLNDNSQLLALMITRKIPSNQASMVLDYLNGNLKFSTLFEGLPREVLSELRQSWGEGQMLDALRKIISGGNADKAMFNQTLKTENIATELVFQELATKLPKFNEEGQIFFQWPVFWGDSEVPDTLEGEAYVPDKENSEQGFGLRLIVTPPKLGQIEIFMNGIKRNLSVNFGVEDKAFEPIKSIFEATRKQILSLGDFDSVKLTIRNRMPTKNFFVKETKIALEPQSQKRFSLDLRA